MKYSDLLVWQKSMDLVEAVYAVTRSSLPPEERYGLAAQMQRAAVSIPCNIAEGHGRKSTGAYLNHLSIAHGSLTELETLLQLAARLGYLSPASLGPMVARTEEVGRMLHGLQVSLGAEQ